jgi:hypothetical protein
LPFLLNSSCCSRYGYLTADCKVADGDLTVRCKVPGTLPAQLAERSLERDKKQGTSPRWDSDPRPKVYETFALPAELLGQNKATSAARYLMLRAKINTTEISFLV